MLWQQLQLGRLTVAHIEGMLTDDSSILRRQLLCVLAALRCAFLSAVDRAWFTAQNYNEDNSFSSTDRRCAGGPSHGAGATAFAALALPPTSIKYVENLIVTDTGNAHAST
jgi:hypothetical protein